MDHREIHGIVIGNVDWKLMEFMELIGNVDYREFNGGIYHLMPRNGDNGQSIS